MRIEEIANVLASLKGGGRKTLIVAAILAAFAMTVPHASANPVTRIEQGGMTLWCISDEMSESGSTECYPFPVANPQSPPPPQPSPAACARPEGDSQ